MSDEKKKDLHVQAYEEAREEFKKKRVKEVKELVLKTLEKLESVKKKKARLEEEERILKLDLEDLRQGRFEKARERQEKSNVAKDVSVDIPDSLLTLTKTIAGGAGKNWNPLLPDRYNTVWYEVDTTTPMIYSSSTSTSSKNGCFTLTATNDGWKTLTSGTYTVGDKNFYF